MRILVFLSWLVIASSTISKEVCEFKSQTSSDEVKYTEQHSIVVNDIEGHVIRIFKTETTPKNPKKNCEGLKAAKIVFHGISDYINKNGKVNGYSITTFNDGSKLFSSVSGVSHTPQNQSKNGYVQTTSIITGGTGVYKGVTGFAKGNTEFNPETGYSAGSSESFYSINK